MGLGQMFLSIASIALMGVLVLNMNTSYMEISDKALYQSDYAIDAISICESYVELAIGKAYDEQTIISATSNTSSLTGKNDLGPDSPEGSKSTMILMTLMTLIIIKILSTRIEGFHNFN